MSDIRRQITRMFAFSDSDAPEKTPSKGVSKYPAISIVDFESKLLSLAPTAFAIVV